MIYATVNMTIGDYSSTCDNKILLYRGDKNVEIRIVMKGNKFTVLDSTYAQMIIRRPSTTSVFSEPAPIQNDTVIFVITEDMIDELKEIGEYTFQIRLYDNTMTARATLPPCNSALIIERPIAVEGEAAVNLAIVNDSAVMLADPTSVEEDIFTEDNKYNRTIWVDGDLITDARLNKIEEALYYINENGGNGSGGGATAPYISTELPETVMVGSDENFDLNLFFNSPNMGKGTLRVFINDADAMSMKIDQGDITAVIPGNLFTKGTNRVVVYVLDRVGVMSNSLVFYIRYGSTEISSDFDPYSAYDYGATIRYYFTPTALDTSLSLTFYMSIDGQVQQGINCTSDTRGYYTFPTNLSADSHYCEAYVVDSNGTKSNVLSFNLIILDADTLVVASDTKEVSVEEGEQVSLDYKVYMKYNTSFIANVYVDGELVNTGVCNADFNYYKTSSLTKGTHTVKLEVFDVTETHSDYITWTVVITESTYEMLQPVNAGAMFIGTAVNKTNTDERKQYFIGHDQEGNEVLGTLSNFAYNSESGWVNDELIISGNSHVEIPVQPLANNAKYGFTLDIEFTSKQIGVTDAEVLTLWNDETNCGVKITTEKLILQSSNGNKCDLYFTDNEKTHVMFVIDRQELKAKIYLNGVMCEAFHLNDYTVDGVAYLDDFTVNSNIVLGGLNTNGYCKIRNIRVYQVALTTDEIINNFISCEIDKTKQRELVNFQKGDDLPTLYVYCDFSGLGKDDKKPCKIVYNSTNEELYGKSFNLDHKQSQLQYQGTSSMAYPIKNYRLNLRDENGKKWYYNFPGGQGECRFTLKADFMSSGHWTNTGMAKFINDNLYNYNSNDEKSMNPFRWYHVQNGDDVSKYRETINGFPCRLILVNDGESPLNEGQNEPTPGNTKDMGIFNFNNDKDNVKTLGFNSDIFPNCASYEVTANSDTSAGAFMSYSGDGDEADELAYLKESFELRHPDEDDVAEDWGFMGVETKEPVQVIDYALMDPNIKITTVMESPKSMSIETASNCTFFFAYYKDGQWTNNSGDFGGTSPVDLTGRPETHVAIGLRGGQSEEYIIINGVKYLFGNEVARNTFKDPYPSETVFETVFNTSYGLKALIDWVDNCTDEEFVSDFEEHFHKDYTLRYFCLVTLIGAVDNLGKNMMLDTADNKIYFPRFYDIDTICSYDNSGQLKFDVDIEMEQGYWNTSSSRLWTRIRDLMHDDIVTTYNNMRQNGVSYENMMYYIYDEQIAKIPQTYYNKDYDVKYAPFADSYIGMAHGDTYEHVKRWLKQRFTFVDSLFDYAPSYNNDILTIRVNTTEEITLHLETYTPVYQHLSWYNGQMDKKKIDGKTSITFSGKVQAATDQEVLIYGGSNIKKITGIQSGNPNRLILGSATKLTELDASNCPLLAEINMNKANLSHHKYLNKVNLSNCPLLEGNLRLNNSPLIQELDIRGTNITGMNLPSSIRNLQVLKLPNTMTELTLNDAGMLHTLEFDEGVALQSISMTNCNALTNVVNFDLLQTPSIVLNNSYNTAAELYFRDTTNLSLSNMSNLERVIFTPNNEYETFELINVANAPDYKVTTFNCPKLSTFMTTAPYRESYNNGDYGDIQPNTTFTANSIDISNTQFTDVKLLCTTDTNTLKLPTTVKNFYCDSSFDLDTNYLEDGEYDVVHGELIEPYTTDYEGEVCIYRAKENSTLSFDDLTWNLGVLDTTTGLVNANNTRYTCDEFIPVQGDTDLTTIYEILAFVEYDENKNFLSARGWTGGGYVMHLNANTRYVRFSIYPHQIADDVKQFKINYTGLQPYPPNLIPSSADGSLIFSMYAPSNTVAPASGTWDLHGLEFDNFHTFGMNNDVKQDSEGNITMPARYDDYNITIKNAYITPKTHNTMLYPLLVNEDNPITGTLDYTNYTGKHLSWSFAYTDLDKVQITQPREDLLGSYEYKYNAFYDTEYEFDNPYEIAKYTSSTSGVLPTFNTEFTYTYDEINNGDGTYTTKVYADSLDNLPTNISFYGKTTLLTVDKLNTSNVANFRNILASCSSLTSVNAANWDTSNVTDMHFMFGYNNVLSTIIGLDTWDTKNVINMDVMFQNCYGLTSLDLSNWDTSKVTNMQGMFSGCRNLTSLDLSSFDTSKVTSTDNMFNGCNNLTTLDISGFNTSNVTSMAGMFYNCGKLTSLDLSNFNTSNVTNMANMFNGCSSLTSLDVSGFDMSNVTNMSYMFSGCRNLTSLDLSSFDTSKVTSMANMFYNCSGLTTLDLSGFDTKNVTNMSGMFNGCSALTSLNVENWPSDNVNTIIPQLSVSPSTSTLYGTVSINESTLPSGWIYEFNDLFVVAIYKVNTSGARMIIYPTDYITQSELDNGDGTYTVTATTSDLTQTPTNIDTYLSSSSSVRASLVEVVKLNADKIINWGGDYETLGAFAKCTNLTNVNIDWGDMSNVTSFGNLFMGCTKLEKVDMSHLNFSSLTSVKRMFYGCSSLKEVDFTGCKGDKISDVNEWFNGCSNLEQIKGLNSLEINVIQSNNSSGCGSASSTFAYCAKLKTLDLSNWVLSYCYSTSDFFKNCSSLTEITGLNTLSLFTEYWTNGASIASMFYGCSSLTNLDFTDNNWGWSYVKDMGGMFYNCTSLTSLDVSGFDTSKVTSMTNMFQNCRGLTSLDSMQNISVALSLSSTKLDAISLLDVINNLATVTTTKTLTLGSTLLAKLTEEQIAIATNKGWTVV